MTSIKRLSPGQMTLATLRELFEGSPTLALDEESRDRVAQAEATVGAILDSGRTVYGINTGFGVLAQTSIPRASLTELQRNLVLSHSTGVGDNLDDATVGLILALKASSLARGHSGVRWLIIETLLALYNARVFPCIPAKGSVGASGDLAPLAHMAATLLGEGRMRHQGREMPAVEGLALAGIEPLTLAPKKGWR
ncbi:hypothetical protein HORIV_23320 [Vreelandella olivaria]|uniref:Histidine ammonia-lyase n=1 Tax=Vreelandella olivaria TaxID=390919 RepID=A0ABM7GGZ2_9GAMM|nr:hypothetical protein HORIV_23320 [Halomonas olivaria]